MLPQAFTITRALCESSNHLASKLFCLTWSYSTNSTTPAPRSEVTTLCCFKHDDIDDNDDDDDDYYFLNPRLKIPEGGVLLL